MIQYSTEKQLPTFFSSLQAAIESLETRLETAAYVVKLKSRKRVSLLLLSAVIFVPFVSVPANSAPIPNFEKPVDFNVREQNVGDFLIALFQEIDVPVSINTAMEGKVNGQFRDSARNVFKEISSAFNVVIYYDGAVVQTYMKNEVNRRLIPSSTSDAKRIVSIVEKLGLPDSLNNIKHEDSGLLVTGFQKFQSQVDEIITSVQASPVVAENKKTKAKLAVQKESFPEESPVAYQVFKLKHAWANDTTFPVAGQSIVIPGVATILNELVLDDGSFGDDSAAANTPDALSGLKGQGLASRKNKNASGSKPSGKTDSSKGAGPRIVADSRLNAIIIRDTADKMPAYQRLIDSLDIESGMVEIEATIIDINTDRSRDLGLNWRYQGGGADLLFGNGSASDQSLIGGNGPITPQGQGGILSFSLGEPANFLARVRALERQGAARVISKPHVITLSDVEAVLAATTEFFVRVAGDQEVDLFNVPVGTTLRVTPHVFKDGAQSRIKLLVNIEDGSQTSSTPVDNIPVVERANISTQAVVNDGDSLLVGGLVRDSYRNSGYQVPVLGRIPVIGGLFRSKTNQATRIERLFLITPRIASGIGFKGKNNTTTLAGDQNRIVEDASRRMDRLDTPYRPAISYWSEESRNRKPAEIVSQPSTTAYEISNNTSQQALISASSQQQAVIGTKLKQTPGVALPQGNGYATIQGSVFITPFKVEPWTVTN